MKATETLSKALGFAHFCTSQSTFFKIFHFKPLFVSCASSGGLFRSFGASRESKKHEDHLKMYGKRAEKGRFPCFPLDFNQVLRRLLLLLLPEGVEAFRLHLTGSKQQGGRGQQELAPERLEKAAGASGQ